MQKLFLFIFLIPAFATAQRYQEQVNFNAQGNQTIALGRYQIGTAIRIEVQISGGWAQDGGIYHIVSDWGRIPKVTFRSESSISDRLKFYGYVDPSSKGRAYLFATWENQSPSGTYNNDVKFTIYSEGAIEINTNGTFTDAVELENILSVNALSENVGIGTTDTDDYKLSVAGNIRAEEVKVEASPWPDYVFEEDYDLKSLEETEEYIRENKHLPNMPSAAEVEENGVSLGEMNAKLLEKIEELTLYVIELKKTQEQLLKDNKKLHSKIKSLTND